MGIRSLNRYLIDKCSKSAVKKKHLSTFCDTIMVIDTSIYMYKFLGEFNRGETRLYDGIHKMCQTLQMYKITPIFVFDGPPPPEKQQVILGRTTDKQNAEKEYNQYVQSTSDPNPEIMNNMKKQFIRIKDEEIKTVKTIINSYNIEYKEATGEADTLCAQIIRTEQAWGCLSNDMDMFAYGCPHILRELDLDTNTVMYYNVRIILREMDISMKLFRQVIILSGTDYNPTNDTPLYESMRLVREYQKYVIDIQNCPYDKHNQILPFYSWILKHTSYIKDYDKLIHTYRMFSKGANTSFTQMNISTK